MVDTPRTTAQIQADMPDGGPYGGINPQKFRNAFLSGPQYDAIAGVAAPYILRGTYDGAAYFVANGGVAGAGQSSGQRTTNGTVLNALFAAANTNNKNVELEPGVYEINNAGGLLWPADAQSGSIFRGSKRQTLVIQFATNAPILTIGDTTGATPTAGLNFSGIGLQYGVTQTGQTAAFALVIGELQQSVISDVCVSGGNAPYDAIRINPTGFVFDCQFHNWEVWAFQRHGMYFNAPTSTGNAWVNARFSPGNVGAPAAISGSCIYFSDLNSDDMTFILTRCEWASGNAAPAVSFAQQHGMFFDSLHLEGITLTGASPYANYFYDANAVINGLDIVDLKTTGSTGTAALFNCGDFNGGFGSSVKVTGLAWSNNHATQLSTPLNILNATPLKDSSTSFRIEAGKVNFGANASDLQTAVQFDSHMPLASFKFPIGWGRYSFGAGGSRVENAGIPVSATYTHYGQHAWSDILVPVSITSFTIKLSNLMGATGTQNVLTGTVVHIRRLSGTPAGTLTVTDDTPTTLTTNTTAATDYFYVFNGTHYVAFTPVT